MRIERRQTARERVNQGANAVFNGRQSVMHCTLRNRSKTGAMLRMTDDIDLPATFEIVALDGAANARASQRWRRGDDVGVVFLTEAESRPDEPVCLAMVRQRRAALCTDG